MIGYGTFAAYYDQFTANVDYDAWAQYLLDLFKRHRGTTPQSVLDLACGTGGLTTRLLDAGCEVVGVDMSAEMLMKATEKTAPYGDRCMLLCQDMRELDLFGTVEGAVCMLDSLNHLTRTNDLKEVFRRLGLFIEKDGLLIFDVNTVYKHQSVLGDNAFVYENDGVFCSWQNHWMPRTGEVDIQLDFFVEDGDVYERFTEYIRERAYTERTWKRLLSETGFEVLAVYEELTDTPPTPTTQRMVFVARNTALQQRNG